MAFNPLDCGKNKLQLDLDAADKLLAEKKAALKNAVDEVGDAYTTALSDLKSAATDKLSALNLTIPEIPKIPNFQEEIDKLMEDAKSLNPTILKDLQKLEDSWKDIIPLDKIQGLTDKIKNPIMELVDGNLIPKIDIDICKETPKQDAEIDSTGKLKKKQTPPVAKSPEETVKPDPVEAKPPAAEEVVLVPEPDEKPTGKEPKTPSEFTIHQAMAAKRALIAAEKTILKKIKDAENKAIGEITPKKRKSNANKEINKLRKAIPEAFKKQYKDTALEYDYYCGDEWNGKVPDKLNKYVLKKSKQAAFADMRKAIKGLNARMINTFSGIPTKDGKERWSGGWDPRFERELRAALYYDQGFGIREYHPNYGLGLRDKFKTKVVADKVKPAFELKIRDYTSAFTPRYQDGDGVKNGTYTEEPDTQFSNLIKEYVEAIYNAKVTLNDTEYIAWVVLVSYELDISLDELNSSDGYPKEKDFLPTSLGGKLPPYEDYLDGIIAEQGGSAEGLKHAEATFQPHYMFKLIPEQNVILSKLAEKYEEHLQLVKDGYVHDSKGI